MQNLIAREVLNKKNKVFIKSLVVICFSMFIIFLFNIKVSAASRVIYDIEQVSLSSYKIDLRWNKENLGNIQITGYTKKDDNTILISYNKNSKIHLSTVTIDLNDLNMMLLLNKPNIILVDEDGKIDRLKDVADISEMDIAISNLYLQGIINGYEDGTFKPDSLITKEEFCSMFFNMMKYELDTSMNSKFYDLTNERWSKNIIMTLNKLGVITGQDDGNFGTLKHVTLGEVAAIIQRAKKIIRIPSDKLMVHDKNFHWANEYISILVSNNLINESDKFYYETSQDLKLTRGEVAILLNRS